MVCEVSETSKVGIRAQGVLILVLMEDGLRVLILKLGRARDELS